MLLIVSNSLDATADYLSTVLVEGKVPFIRFDTDKTLNGAEFKFDGGLPGLRISDTWHQPQDFSSVWYRRPERLRIDGYDDSPESKFALDEWSEALEGFFAHIPVKRWMNHPAANVGASHKLEQLTVASRLGFEVPRTLVTQDARRLGQFYSENDGKVIVKPLSVGHIERADGTESVIYTNRLSDTDLNGLSDLKGCPTLFQAYIDKASDVRITVVDDDVHAIQMIARGGDGGQRCDIRRDNMRDVAYSQIPLPNGVEASVSALMRHYGLRFAAIDMAVTHDGRWVFFEVNPNGQWAWFDLAGVARIASSFVRSFAREE
jgi:hypothetical protein